MTLRNVLLIFVAILLTGATALVARSWLESQRIQVANTAPAQVAVEPEPAVQVMVAKRDIATGSFLKESDILWQAWPDDSLASGYLVKDQIPEKELTELLEGAVVRRGFTSGEPITLARVVKPGDRGFLAVVLKPGFRAVSVKVDAESSIAGLVFPGDRVDIILTHALKDIDEPKSPPRHASETVLTNVRVLAIDQLIDDQTPDPKLGKTVTLEVDPKQAEMIAVTRKLGELSLALQPLAKSEEELERITNQGQPIEEPDPSRGRSLTWESEVSRLLPPPPGSERIVKVDRGNTSEELRF